MGTGPRVRHLLPANDALDRLYMAVAHRLLSGQPFSSLVEGDLLKPAAGMRLHKLYHDPHTLEGLGQVIHLLRALARLITRKREPLGSLFRLVLS